MRLVIALAAGSVLGACTFNVQAGTGSRVGSSDATFSTLSVDLTDGRMRDGLVRVTGSARTGARATVSATGLLGASAPASAISDGLTVGLVPGAAGVLRLEVGYAGASPESVLFDEVAIEVPQSVGVAIDVTRGDVVVDGVSGEADVHTRGGAIDVGGTVRVGAATLSTLYDPIVVRAASASVETVGGRVTLDVAGPVDVTTQTGDVVGRFEASGRITSDAGNLRVDLGASPTGDVSLSTDGGEIVLGVPAGASLVLDLDTRGGALSVATADVTHDGTTPVVLTLGSGGPRVTLRAMARSIRVEER